MTKEITKAYILQQMQDKFKLRDFETAPFLFNETVIPVYNIEQHLEKWETVYVTTSVTGMGPKLFFTVPENERWYLRRYDVVFMTGVYTIAGIYTQRVAAITGRSCYLDLGAAKSVSYHIDLVEPVVLSSGDIIYANIDGYTSTGDLRLYIDYMAEEIR